MYPPSLQASVTATFCARPAQNGHGFHFRFIAGGLSVADCAEILSLKCIRLMTGAHDRSPTVPLSGCLVPLWILLEMKNHARTPVRPDRRALPPRSRALLIRSSQ
jgi:hypothetical protein